MYILLLKSPAAEDPEGLDVITINGEDATVIPIQEVQKPKFMFSGIKVIILPFCRLKNC